MKLQLFEIIQRRLETLLSQAVGVLGKRGPQLTLAAVLGAFCVNLPQARAWLEERLFVAPYMTARAALGRAPRLDSSIRVIVQDDRALRRFGRLINLDDWYAVASMLFERGYERVLLLGVHDGANTETRERAAEHRFFAVGAAAAPKTNPRARAPIDLGDGWLIAGSAEPNRPLPEAVLAPTRAAAPFIDALGALNMASSLRIETRQSVTAELGMPAIGLWASDVGTAAPPVVYVEYLAPDSVQAASLALNSVLDVTGRRARRALAPEEEKKIAGGRVAILVADGYTGSRFVETPLGLLLTHHATTAIAHAARAGRFLRPATDNAALAAAGIALIAAATGVTSGLGCYALWLGLSGILLVASILTFELGATVLPVAQIIVGSSPVLAVCAIYHFLSTYRAKLLLSRDLAVGMEVQALVLPQPGPFRVGDFEFTIDFRPYGPMSGDWYQVFVDPDRRRAVIVVGDVVGKGPGAALATAVIASVFRSAVAQWDEGAAIEADRLVLQLEDTMRATFRGVQNTTLIMLVLEEDALRVTHIGSAPWVIVPGGAEAPTVVRCQASDPLGIRTARRRSIKWQEPVLQPGGLLAAATDGMIDGSRGAHATTRAIVRLLESGDELSLATVREALKDPDVVPDIEDDATLLLVRRLPKGETGLVAA